jgi:hypothetical protein
MRILFYRDATPINVADRAAIRETVIPLNTVADLECSGLVAGHSPCRQTQHAEAGGGRD